MTAPDPKKRPSFTQAEIDLVRNALRNMGVRRDLDDATSKALLDVAEHLGAYDPARPIAPWLLGFARLTAKETRRKDRVRTEREILAGDVEALEACPEGPDPWSDLVTRRQLAILQRILDEIPEPQAQVLVLHVGLGKTVREIAAALGISKSTAGARLVRARRSFQAARERLEARLARRGESLAVLAPLWARFEEVLPDAGADQASVWDVPAPRLPAATPWAAPALSALVAGAGIAASASLLRACDAPTPEPAAFAAMVAAVPVSESARPETVAELPSAPETPAVRPAEARPARAEPARARPLATRPMTATPRPASEAAPREGRADEEEVKAQLHEARTAFARGDAAGALAVLQRLDRREPGGLLGAPRESLRIEVLARLAGARLDEARARAERLRREMPGDPSLRRVTKVLDAL